MLSRRRRFEVSLASEDYLSCIKRRLLTSVCSDARHQESVREKRRHKDESRRRGRRSDESPSDSDDEDEEDEAPKAIEAPPQPTPEQDKLSLPSPPRASSHTATGAERPLMNQSAVPAEEGSH